MNRTLVHIAPCFTTVFKYGKIIVQYRLYTLMCLLQFNWKYKCTPRNFVTKTLVKSIPFILIVWLSSQFLLLNIGIIDRALSFFSTEHYNLKWRRYHIDIHYEVQEVQGNLSRYVSLNHYSNTVCSSQGCGQVLAWYLVLYLYFSTILSVLDVLEYLIGGNSKYLYLIQSTR